MSRACWVLFVLLSAVPAWAAPAYSLKVVKTEPPKEVPPAFAKLLGPDCAQLLDKDGIADDIHLFNDKLREWEDYYNYHRPHGALDGQTPYERLLAKKASARVSPKS